MGGGAPAAELVAGACVRDDCGCIRTRASLLQLLFSLRMKDQLAIVFGLALCASSGACGTAISRDRDGDGTVFGAYPFEAVAIDVEIMGMQGFLLCGLASLPFDLVVDVVASPIDLVAWVCGADKMPSKHASADDPATPRSPWTPRLRSR